MRPAPLEDGALIHTHTHTPTCAFAPTPTCAFTLTSTCAFTSHPCSRAHSRAQVCGQPLSWEDVRPFLVKFDSLDVSRTGRIDKSDLELMVQRNAQAVKGKLERSKSNTTCNASHRAHDHIWQSLFRRP